MEYFDISRRIAPGSVVYPGDPEIRMEAVCPGLIALHGSTHTLTHIDPPAHFIPGGAAVDERGPCGPAGTRGMAMPLKIAPSDGSPVRAVLYR